MVNISNVGSTVTPSPSDNNRPTAAESARTTTHAAMVDPTKQPKFVDRRRNRDRRLLAKKPLLDTRRNLDRRRNSRLHIEI